MSKFSLKRLLGRDDPVPTINGVIHPDKTEIDPLTPWSADQSVREIRTVVRPKGRSDAPKKDRLPGRLLGFAGVIIFAALVGAGIVAYEAQRLFALDHNHTGEATTQADELRAIIIAGLPDAGWVAMALVALVAALRGQSSLRARVGVLIFFGLSLGAQVLYAPKSPEGVLVAVIAPITMAWMLETFIVEVRRWAMSRRNLDALDETPILTGVLLALVRLVRGVLGLLLWLIRLLFDARGTWKGVRGWVLETAPMAPGRTLAGMRAAEALAQASTATATAEQTQAAAAEQVRALEAATERARQESAGQVAEAQAAAAAEIERVRLAAAEQIRAVREEAAAAAAAKVQAAASAEAGAARLRESRQEAEGLRDQLRRYEEYLKNAAADRERLQASYERLASAATGRERLLAAYEQLKVSGDSRFGDRAAVPEVARSLYEGAGLQRLETARTYLHEHLDSLGVPRQTHEGVNA